jgi:hypothetical protein
MSDILGTAEPVATPSLEVEPVGQAITEAVNDQHNQAANAEFLSSLPEALRDMPQIKSIKGAADLATQFVNQQSLIGNSLRIPTADTSEEQTASFYQKLSEVPGVVRMPGEGADEAVMNEFYGKMGVPATPNEYQVSLPEGATLEPEFLQQATASAHALKLSNTQLNQVLNDEIANREQALVDHSNYIDNSKLALKALWSSDYENRVAGATNALRIYKQEMPDHAAELDQFANNPIFVKLLSDVAEQMKETGHAGMQAAGNYGLNVEEAKMKQQEIMSNPKHPYFQGSKDAVDYMLKLNEIIAGATV